MSDLEKEFEATAANVKQESHGGKLKDLPQDKVTEMYSLFKQGMLGDVNIAEPSDALGK
jgi:acyl-CoA-binding protein